MRGVHGVGGIGNWGVRAGGGGGEWLWLALRFVKEDYGKFRSPKPKTLKPSALNPALPTVSIVVPLLGYC